MSVSLSKGGSVSLDKSRYALDEVTIGCGWDVAKPGFFGGLMGGNQDFSRIQNAYVRAVDANGRDMARYVLSSAGTARSVLFAELKRQRGNWEFKAIGEPSRADSFTAYLNDFVARRR